jgi:SNF2 family DNA or RNA helicase
LGAREDFESQFPDDVTAARRLGEIVQPVTIRRKVLDVARDLPELVEIKIPFEMPDALRRRHLQIESTGTSRLAVDTPLRVLCAHAEKDGAELDLFEMPKIEHVLAVLSELAENGEKALVFAPFQMTLDRLSTLVGREVAKAKFVEVMDGRMPAANRQRLVDSFNGFHGSGVLFLNPRAAGVGLNITGANHVIHFSPEYNPQVTEQATARAYRRMQEKTVFVHHFYYRDSIEDGARQIAEDKSALAQALDVGINEEGQL